MSLDQFKQTYITECYELLADMEERLMALDCEAADIEQLNAIFRCAHSIKGGSGAFGLNYITDFTHVLEALLDAMREGKVNASREAVDMLLLSVDIVTRMVDAAKDNAQPPAELGADLLEKLKAHANIKMAGKAAATIKPAKNNQSSTFEISFKPSRTRPAWHNRCRCP